MIETPRYDISKSHFPRLHRAIIDATEYHSGQDRKYSNTPYICHPLAVMQIVRSITEDEDMLIAAVLHDLIEDTNATIEFIENKYGGRVAELVRCLTDASRPEDGNRETRKNIDLVHTAKATPDAKTIKLADLIHNIESIVTSDPNFAKVFMMEVSKLMEVLTEGDNALYKRAMDALLEYENSVLQTSLKT